jgi:hypothetical protein
MWSKIPASIRTEMVNVIGAPKDDPEELLKFIASNKK